ncbi:hypothetical protein A1O3_09701 [Capronia epimyces CBS 606.96]|uniref:Uncharacterized protein n=1 Tax=Capronia epimyces CBS 606.96 TaxID=1182542 RepID=W9XJG0_9EURO|nr:uncharacterized protein A1O3_09701 [Capronia epimyces CBS 606.96]EXJ77475.1 hypothetical protein A1O3_09701 [Capronia epimyces CBS 606.96]
MPGHVAQMQRLFQTAKATLRLDVRYATSPTGTIDSRLPTSSEDGSAGGTDSLVESEGQDSGTPSDEWRYSRAPRLLAGFDVDVREPFPDSSPQLPKLLSVSANHSKLLVAEPPSSGFTSPVDSPNSSPHPEEEEEEEVRAMSTSPTGQPTSNHHAEEQDDSSSLSAAALEGPLTELRVSGDDNMDIDLADESPIVSHLNRRSRDLVMCGQPSPETKRAIILSAPAKAAADSAKVRRGMLSNLFPKPPTHKGSDGEVSSTRSRESQEPVVTPCPDPLLHERGPVVLCPDPGVHYGAGKQIPFGHNTITRAPNMHHYHHHQHSPHSGMAQPSLPFNRATATGSPMPMLKVQSPPVSPRQMRPPSRDAWHGAPHLSHRRHPLHQHEQMNRDYPSGTTEHFQPGWSHAKEGPQTLRPSGPAMYPFSTAAAKVVGQDPAPDSRIRDSYRTDTLTPLARPPTRFRKNGIVALASARGVGKYYGMPAYGPRPSSRSNHSRLVRLPDAQRFRSSPPRSFADSILPAHPRKRSREVETTAIGVLEDRADTGHPLDPKLKLEEGEDVIAVDDETRAAIRMSLYGASAPDAASELDRSITELSPNVVAWRKGARPSGRRKKRRPSYWDDDLEEVVRSPAARHIVSSPVTKEDVRSQQAEVEFQDEPPVQDMAMAHEHDGIEGISRITEGGTALQDDGQMEN